MRITSILIIISAHATQSMGAVCGRMPSLTERRVRTGHMVHLL